MTEAQTKLAALLKREGTGISWCDLTFNPWIGCTKVSPACDHCYAELLATNRLGVEWGAGADRRRTVPSYWTKALRWHRIAAAAGVMLDVFCLSLGDWADNEIPDEWRLDLAAVIQATPNLRWMLLTKRIPNAERYLRAMFPEGVPPNVALGITVVTQAEADRDIPRARAVKGRLGIRWLFLSMEPLLEAVDITPHLWGADVECPGCPRDSDCLCGFQTKAQLGLPSIDLVIVGGESGNHARPMHPKWAFEIIESCHGAGVAAHFKQWGDWQPVIDFTAGIEELTTTAVHMHGRKYTGGDLFRFPDEQLMVRVGTKKAGRMLRGREHQERLAA